MTFLANMARSPGDPKILRSGRSSRNTMDNVGRMLGWMSLGVGMVELFAPRRITGPLGLEGKEALIRAYGVREIGSGMLSLSTEKQAGLWSRVAGDAMDIATLMPALKRSNPQYNNALIAVAAVAGLAVLDVMAAQTHTLQHRQSRGRRRSYRDRTGFPHGVTAARGAARDRATSQNTPAAPPSAIASDLEVGVH